MAQNMPIFSSNFNTVLQRSYDKIVKASLKDSCKIHTTIWEINFKPLHEDHDTKNEHKYYEKWMS